MGYGIWDMGHGIRDKGKGICFFQEEDSKREHDVTDEGKGIREKG